MMRLAYLFKRIVLMIPVFLFGTTFTFVAMYAGPIDPATAVLGPNAPHSRIVEMRAQMGLNQPLWGQYIDFMTGLLTLDWGKSWVLFRNSQITTVLAQFVPRTLWIGVWAVFIPLFIGIPLGFYAGLNSNTWGDYTASFGGIMWRAMPNFWLAVLMLGVLSSSQDIFFGFNWENFLVRTNVVGAPNVSIDALTTWEGFVRATKKALPASIILGSASMGNEIRVGRTAILECKNSKYVEMAKAKGVSDRVIVWKHMFRNALIPLVPMITAEIGLLLGASVLVERVFAINGLGLIFFQSMIRGDVTLASTLMALSIVLLVLTNILQDILYTLIDPRVGFEAR